MLRAMTISLCVVSAATLAGCTEAEIVTRMRPDCGASPTLDGSMPVDPDPTIPDGGPGCSPYRRPMPPVPTTEGPDTPPIAFALKQVGIDQSGERWRRIGYDLDTLCSDGTPGTADCTSVTPPIVTGPAIDGDRGIDNVFGRVLSPALLLVAPALQEQARRQQERGIFAILVQISHYNGTDDDPRLEVVVSQTENVMPSSGVADGGVPSPLAMCGVLPRWDGTDVAFPGDLAFIGGDPTMPRLRDDRAFVSRGVLVARLPDRSDLDVSADGRTARIRLTDAVITGRLSPDRSRLENVVVSGRWAIVDILEVVPLLGLCPGVPADDSQRAVLVQLLNMGADIRSDPTTDRMGLQCDALSFALTLQGFKVGVGEVVPTSTRFTPCPTP